MRVRGSVLIAAHNEAASIVKALDALLADAQPGELGVVVACNGCTDGTADIARTTAMRSGHPVKVIEVPVASKTAAWRVAEAASREPRLYLDADVECSTATARQLLDAVAEHDVAVPSRRLRHEHGSVLARLYYRGWSLLPWVTEQLTGRGAFALSHAARATFDEFPDLVADDRFATSRVPRDRAVIVPGEVTVRPPATLREVVAVRTRVLRGNTVTDVPTHDDVMSKRLRRVMGAGVKPLSLPALVVYAVVTAVVKAKVRSVPRPRPWARATRVSTP